jgi:hypothetical protein
MNDLVVPATSITLNISRPAACGVKSRDELTPLLRLELLLLRDSVIQREQEAREQAAAKLAEAAAAAIETPDAVATAERLREEASALLTISRDWQVQGMLLDILLQGLPQ